ncbi:MAG: DUF6468 domain-containing protein [Pseudomonadota bacterium]
MTGLSLSMAIEALVALLLLLTIGYCVTLNRRLQRLRADEAMMRATISELITATEIAERAIVGLRATATDCEKTLAVRLAEAEHVSARLGEQVSQGETVFQRLAQIAEAARPAAPVVREPAFHRAHAPTPAVGERTMTMRPTASGLGGSGLPAEPVQVDRRADTSEPTSALSLMSAAEAAALRVRNLRRLAGERAA